MTDRHPDGDGPVAVETIERPSPHHAWDVSAMLDAAGRIYELVVTALESVGLTYHEYQVLSYLRGAAGQLRLAQLDEAVRGPGQSASEVVAELVERGMMRLVELGERGAPRVALTPLGSTYAHEGRVRLNAVQREFAMRLDRPDRVGLRRLLDKVAS